MRRFLLLGICGMAFTSLPAQNQIQTHAKNPNYFSWGITPVFLIGAAGFHSWAPISRPGTVQMEQQLERMGNLIDEINSPLIMGLVRWLPYDPMNHVHDGTVKRVLQPWKQEADGRYDLSQFSSG
ncbi:hypothetical protein [Cyclobacterium jeungdonense]|uniref:Uncharacterized protein n=1 Tax=Cyclobacterium jeungdonense TaxID=708087 RepID=A0ABT8CAQ2_9BACT|nr:hypothetical protein [Cyclobacterium jeungdonense]MDN3689874.1 hypothetical protein [Cyclobacterium jeungdonense]